MLKLLGYWRSTAAYRVRIALNHKQISYENISVHLVKEGGEQHKPEFRDINPQGLVPVLIDGAHQINQSMAIIEYIEQKYPLPSLLSDDIALTAKIRAFAQMISCDIHPLNNLRVLKYLSQTLEVSETAKTAWYAHWIEEGFSALEKIAQTHTMNGPFCFGNELSIADVCLIPQIYNANRFNVNMDAFPRLMAINDYCLSLSEFRDAAPENQPDASE